MHSKNIVYRDLKPENVLVDKNGYIKIADFGFAKQIDGQTNTLCGTPEYLAPEILLHQGHGKGVDWWTVGVSIYEMMAGFTPFLDNSQMRMYDNIIHGHYTFPPFFKKDARSLISGMLAHKQSKRLGVICGEAQKIKDHAFFKEIDFKKLGNKEYQAPIIPKVSSDTDAKNFNNAPEEYVPPRYEDDGTEWDKYF